MPVRDFLQDATGDLAVVNGDFALVGGTTDAENLAAVQQGIAIRTRLFKGESYLDESKGIDYLGKVFVKNPDPLAVREEIATAIAETPDVSSVQSAGLAQNAGDRSASISYTVRTPYSTSPVDGTVTP